MHFDTNNYAQEERFLFKYVGVISGSSISGITVSTLNWGMSNFIINFIYFTNIKYFYMFYCDYIIKYIILYT